MLHIRLKTMEEKARIAEEEVKKISSKKMNVQKRIDEIERRRSLLQYLRLPHCNPLEKRLSKLMAEEDDLFMKPVEEKVKGLEDEIDCLESEMKVIDGQLGALKEEE